MGNTEIDQVLWALASKTGEPANNGENAGHASIMGVILGHFSPENALRFLNERRVPSEEIDNSVAYPIVDFDHDPAYGPPPPPESMWFIFLRSDTVIFASRTELREMLSTEMGKESNILDSNRMPKLMDEVESSNIFWAVFDSDANHALLRRLIPAIGLTAASRSALDSSTFEVNIDGSLRPNFEINVRAQLDSPAEAGIVVQSLAKITQDRSESMKNDDPELSDFLNAEQIYSVASDLYMTIRSQDDALFELLDRHRF